MPVENDNSRVGTLAALFFFFFSLISPSLVKPGQGNTVITSHVPDGGATPTTNRAKRAKREKSRRGNSTIWFRRSGSSCPLCCSSWSADMLPLES
ncbi:hypothetical protein ACKS23_04495 [Histoplasma ohiense]